MRLQKLSRTRLACVAFALLAVACVRGEDTPYTRAVSAGERAETAGRFRDAQSSYDRAIIVAERTVDREHAEKLAITMQAKAGDVQGAAKRLREVASAKPEKSTASHALFELARIEEKTGDPVAAHATYEEILHRFPNSALSRRALHHVLLDVEEEGGPQATLSYLDSVSERLSTTILAEPVAYQRALRLEALGQKNNARRAYLDVAARWPYPKGDLFDNALVHASAIAEEEGDYASAVADLERLLSTREVADLIGTYQRPEYTRALWHLAEIHRDRLHDDARARATFHRLYADFKSSPRRDDALFEEARLSEDPCPVLDTLVDHFPNSRYVACAVERCKDIERPQKSEARETCHYTLTRSHP